MSTQQQQQNQMDIRNMDPRSYFEAALGDMSTSCQEDTIASLNGGNLCGPLCKCSSCCNGQQGSSNRSLMTTSTRTDMSDDDSYLGVERSPITITKVVVEGDDGLANNDDLREQKMDAGHEFIEDIPMPNPAITDVRKLRNELEELQEQDKELSLLKMRFETAKDELLMMLEEAESKQRRLRLAAQRTKLERPRDDSLYDGYTR